jgi:hypothetical protein
MGMEEPVECVYKEKPPQFKWHHPVDIFGVTLVLCAEWMLGEQGWRQEHHYRGCDSSSGKRSEYKLIWGVVRRMRRGSVGRTQDCNLQDLGRRQRMLVRKGDEPKMTARVFA